MSNTAKAQNCKREKLFQDRAVVGRSLERSEALSNESSLFQAKGQAGLPVFCIEPLEDPLS